MSQRCISGATVVPCTIGGLAFPNDADGRCTLYYWIRAKEQAVETIQVGRVIKFEFDFAAA